MNKDDKYANAVRDSDGHLNKIIESQSRKKIVVAGPGTGKTYLFKMLIEKMINSKGALTLTFVNSLVDDLSLELSGLSKVKTLHGFALECLRNVRHKGEKKYKDIKISPNLPKVIEEDYRGLEGGEIEFEKLFNNRDDDNELIKFYKKRKDYYGKYCGKYYGFSDIIFALLKYFERHENKIPTYDLVLIDEFQDFNRLEISLIDQLMRKSPIIFVGDDDQALYKDIRDTSTIYIRERFNNNDGEYEAFTLPYCRRCPRVIVEAVNDIINGARSSGFLENRVDKRYQYFDQEKKDKISLLHPEIIHCKTFDNAIPSFIEIELDKASKIEREKFSVLIISPWGKHCRYIAKALMNKGFLNIDTGKNPAPEDQKLIDGLKILLEKNNSKSNLGWRMVSKFRLKPEEFQKVLKMSNEEGAELFMNMIDPQEKKEIKKILTSLRKLRDEPDSMTDNGIDEISRMVNLNPQDLVKSHLRKEFPPVSQRIANRGLKNLHVQLTTVERAKGLSADYVFITHFDDKFFNEKKIGSEITNKDIRKFIVSLTRAERKIFLISADKSNEPTLLKWIQKERIHKTEYPAGTSG
ncbi:MAG: ATP-dependent helicase [Candidatus Marinimicrobia bacterium]|nr:ATP-dependent helicase [Candidatus Neomarinimicrobiota bacterium]